MYPCVTSTEGLQGLYYVHYHSLIKLIFFLVKIIFAELSQALLLQNVAYGNFAVNANLISFKIK